MSEEYTVNHNQHKMGLVLQQYEYKVILMHMYMWFVCFLAHTVHHQGFPQMWCT